jgi:electron transport complex protein RnfD
MREIRPDLSLATAPFLRTQLSTTRVMMEVVVALLPVLAAAVLFFGLGALLIVLSGTTGALATEWLITRKKGALGALEDGSALLTGIVFALTLPPSFPLWMAFLGGIVSIALGKAIWGGLGRNLFNPALVGRAFLQSAFPTAITTWTPHGQDTLSLPASVTALPFMKSGADVVTSATPLGLSKFEGITTDLLSLLLGKTGGSLGETSALLLIALGLWLGIRRIFDWRLPVSTLITVAALSGALHLWRPQSYPDPLFMICAGSLLFGAVFMVTDPVTTPITPRGAWIFGLGVGVLVVLIRLFGGLPEGVMYAILLMNSVTPLINRYTQPRVFGS